jgi:hypothetical protein
MQLLSTWLKDLRLLLRDRGEMASLFLMPLAFILPICTGLSGQRLQPQRRPQADLAGGQLRPGGWPVKRANTRTALLDALAESYNCAPTICPPMSNLSSSLARPPAPHQPGLRRSRGAAARRPTTTDPAGAAHPRRLLRRHRRGRACLGDAALQPGAQPRSTASWWRACHRQHDAPLHRKPDVRGHGAVQSDLIVLAPEVIRDQHRRRTQRGRRARGGGTAGPPALAVVSASGPPTRALTDDAQHAAADDPRLHGHVCLFSDRHGRRLDPAGAQRRHAAPAAS